MKGMRMKKIVSIVLAIAAILSLVFFDARNVNAQDYYYGETFVIKASEIKVGNFDGYSYDGSKLTFIEDSDHQVRNFIIDMDVDLAVNDLDFDIYSNDDFIFEIKGDNKFTVLGDKNSNSLNFNNPSKFCIWIVVESGATFICNRGLEVARIDIKENANAIFNLYNSGLVCHYFNSCGKVYIDGSVEVFDDMKISGGDFKAYTSLDVLGDYVQTGGNVYINSGSCAIAVETFYISGGYFECNNVSDDPKELALKIPLINTSNIDIANTLCIKVPSEYTMKKDYDEYGAERLFIYDKDGNIPRTIVIDKIVKEKDTTDDTTNNSNNTNNTNNSNNLNSSGPNNSATPNTSVDKKNTGKNYSSEWIDGKWYESDGSQIYEPLGKWMNDSSGWWFEDTSGWYPINQWQRIDGKWYYFTETGYMDYAEYRDGYWLGNDGAWDEAYSGGHWCSDGTGWWYEDASGWYPVSQWLWIDGKCYYFKSTGYMAVSEYIDGYWVNASGEWAQ